MSALSNRTQSLEEQPAGKRPSAKAAGHRSNPGILVQLYRLAVQSTQGIALQKYRTCRHTSTVHTDASTFQASTERTLGATGAAVRAVSCRLRLRPYLGGSAQAAARAPCWPELGGKLSSESARRTGGAKAKPAPAQGCMHSCGCLTTAD